MGFLITDDSYYRVFKDFYFPSKEDWTGFQKDYQNGQYRFRVIKEVDSFIILFNGYSDEYFDLSPLNWTSEVGRGWGNYIRIEYRDANRKWQSIYKMESAQSAMSQLVKIIMKKKNKQNRIFLT